MTLHSGLAIPSRRTQAFVYLHHAAVQTYVHIICVGIGQVATRYPVKKPRIVSEKNMQDPKP